MGTPHDSPTTAAVSGRVPRGKELGDSETIMADGNSDRLGGSVHCVTAVNAEIARKSTIVHLGGTAGSDLLLASC
jgi:hypothetical protein